MTGRAWSNTYSRFGNTGAMTQAKVLQGPAVEEDHRPQLGSALRSQGLLVAERGDADPVDDRRELRPQRHVDTVGRVGLAVEVRQLLGREPDRVRALRRAAPGRSGPRSCSAWKRVREQHPLRRAAVDRDVGVAGERVGVVVGRRATAPGWSSGRVSAYGAGGSAPDVEGQRVGVARVAADRRSPPCRRWPASTSGTLAVPARRRVLGLVPGRRQRAGGRRDAEPVERRVRRTRRSRVTLLTPPRQEHLRPPGRPLDRRERRAVDGQRGACRGRRRRGRASPRRRRPQYTQNVADCRRGRGRRGPRPDVPAAVAGSGAARARRARPRRPSARGRVGQRQVDLVDDRVALGRPACRRGSCAASDDRVVARGQLRPWCRCGPRPPTCSRAAGSSSCSAAPSTRRNTLVGPCSGDQVVGVQRVGEDAQVVACRSCGTVDGEVEHAVGAGAQAADVVPAGGVELAHVRRASPPGRSRL